MWECLDEVVVGCLECDGFAGQGFEVLSLTNVGGRTSDEEDVRGVDDRSSSEPGCCLTGCDLSLIRVVVENVSELLLVHPTEGLGDLLGECIGDGVGVTDSLPLDDLDFLHGDGDLVEPLYVDVLGHDVHSYCTLEPILNR